MKSRALEDIRQRFPTVVKAEDVSWLLTVPAIWDDFSKFFMRDAAERVSYILYSKSMKTQHSYIRYLSNMDLSIKILFSSDNCTLHVLSKEYSLYWLVVNAHCLNVFVRKQITTDGFIFVGTNFRGFKENDTFVGFKIRGHSIFLHNSFRKSLIRGY